MRHSLKYRIALVIFVLEAGMMAVVLWQTLGHSLESSRAQLTASEKTMLELVGGISRVSLLTEEYADLQPYLEDLEQEPRVVRAVLADDSGRVVASTHTGDVGASLAATLAADAQSDVYWRRQPLTNATGTLGELAIGFSNQALLESYQRSRDLGIAIAVSGMFIIAFVGIGMGALLTRRLERVTDAARLFAAGEHDVRTELTGNDEVAALARSFDEMAGSVARHQQALRDQHEQLEDLVEKRTRELRDAHEELVRSERLATLGQLTATVAHELRNPLGAIRASAHLLQDPARTSDEQRNRAVDRLDRNIDRCDRIISELYDFTRVRSLERQATALDPWLEDVLGECAIPQEVSVELDLHLGDTRVAVDVELLRRAVMNVIANARQALEAAPPPPVRRLTLGSRVHGERIEIVVSDTGRGMAADLLERVFEPLYSTRAFGVGLGLSVVRQVMNQHGGGVEVASEEGRGTTVTLWVPQEIA